MTIGQLWFAINLACFPITTTSFLLDLKELASVYLSNTNGEQRRTTNRRALNSATFWVTALAMFLISLDATLSQHQRFERGILFNLGVILIVFVSINIFIASFYSLLQRAEDFSVARRVDTDGQEYEEAKKNHSFRGLKMRLEWLGYGQAMKHQILT